MALCKRSPMLTDDEIIDIVLKYIDENIYNYAVKILLLNLDKAIMMYNQKGSEVGERNTL